MDSNLRQQAIDLYDRFTHEGMDRRLFMGRMVAIAGSVAAAEALIASIAASPAAAAIVPANDKRIDAEKRLLAIANGPSYQAYVARPKGQSRRPIVMVIHENRGLTDHIRDVTRRFAVAGFSALAPDFLSSAGGTPADEDAAREAIGKLDLNKTVGDAALLLTTLGKESPEGKVGAVGFCWGGGFVNRLAAAAGSALNAGVPFYGPAPEPAEAAKVSAPMQFHLAGLDTRIAQTAWPFISALGTQGKPVEAFNYPGVNHAFHNDTSAERYDKAAATLAWERTLDFFRRHLG